MADVVSPEVRSRMMSGIRDKNTKPEMILRRGLHRLGFRYQLHRADLPGKPDLVFAKHRAVILAQGCFWHGHGCHLFKWPKTREEFWRTKIGRNVENDARTVEALRAQGWRVATVWECALKGRTRLDQHDTMRNLAEWLQSDEETVTIRGGE